MDPTTNEYEYQASGASGGRTVWKVLGGSVLAVFLVAGIIGGVVLTKREAANQASAATAVSAVVTLTMGGSPSPETITVKRGQSVTWTNADGRYDRSIEAVGDSAEALPGFGTTEPLAKGESYSYVFEQAGTFHYAESATSPTNGTVIVTE